ncbi:hypothetical protein [Chengkuizengella marina]|uniref:Uncharacterized protein n=1 Tax=Chengkuizengella marina TaxID=2507566 RepID=A0A6N9Q947_9BACL|nr:hypothetical protein [Chengkuizengella marina]NBI31211.1 hypothetical protein [Chengkuizengella marina]
MGAFHRTTCDCCVCPMQCVMKQLEDRGPIIISTTVSQEFNLIKSVENFIADTLDGEIPEFFPVCKVTAVGSNALDITTDLKPLRRDIKGKCNCCEDPTTNELVSLGIGTEVSVEFVTQTPGDRFRVPLTGNILSFGEGIVILDNVSDGEGDELPNFAISTCQITNIQKTS